MTRLEQITAAVLSGLNHDGHCAATIAIRAVAIAVEVCKELDEVTLTEAKSD